MLSEEETRRILVKVDTELDEIADFVFSKSQENIVEMGITDEGHLLISGFVNRAFMEKEVGYSAPQALWNEFGTDPHMPPVEPLMAWAHRKLGLGDKEARKAAWGIAKTIEKEGTDPRPFFRDALNATAQKYGVSIIGT